MSGSLARSLQVATPAQLVHTRHAPLRATYRVQLNREFTFNHAREIVPYLSRLGISHLYVSPILKARAGSMHGYDVVDFTRLNPELGTVEDFEALVAALHAHSLGLIVDFVPNHAGILTNDNAWWQDVLEHGPAARYAQHFDIDWHPARVSMRNRVLVPILRDSLGATLDAGELRVEFQLEKGQFVVAYFDHFLPLDPREYPRLFPGHVEAATDLGDILRLCTTMPARDETSETARLQRYDIAARIQSRLSSIDTPTRVQIDAALLALCAPSGAALLGECLDHQAYRLAQWRVARDEINYRRFFDVPELAALRMQEPAVFDDTHREILRWLERGAIDGLRIDHPDGLFDPEEYFQRLQAVSPEQPLYVAVEKILASHERLPAQWPVSGTTGYEFAALGVAWLHDGAGEATLDRIYRSFLERPLVGGSDAPRVVIDDAVAAATADSTSFFDLASQTRRLVMHSVLAAEIAVLATHADRIAQRDRHTADFTRDTLRTALIEVIASFPVYRTYRSTRGLSSEDERYIDWAIRVARRRSPLADPSVFDFLRELLTGAADVNLDPAARRERVDFALKFQQVSSPVMAKGVEDTALYIYHRQIALNDVGSDPRIFSVATATVHRANEARARDWPATMLATSTHDSKRSEDVRARLAVLSELPELWRKAVTRWSQLHRSKRRLVDGVAAPSRNREYYLYQSLLGIWPLAGQGDVDASLVERMQEHALKSMREAKTNSSWTNPNPEYEAAVTEFVAHLLDKPRRNAFVRDMSKLVDTIGYFGMLNSLSLTLLKLCSPGVPDFYQGTELPTFTLVDPDNRRAVDFAAREARLQSESDPVSLLSRWQDGQLKLQLIRRLLEMRKSDPELFTRGDYRVLPVAGPAADHVCAFARVFEARALVVIATRGFAKLSAGIVRPPHEMPWGDTCVMIPPELEVAGQGDGRAPPSILISEQLRQFPLMAWPARNLEGLSRVQSRRFAHN